ncbi:MAG: carboxylesterase family protein [Clostridia bacterium]|nr:carboxylesterase family protein [Clostridia bacterium]
MQHIVNTRCGAVQGVQLSNGTIAYKGIRYATAGRFEYPTEVTSWEGIYDASDYGACAYQARSFVNEAELPQKAFYFNEFRCGVDYTYSEDCLFLNIFTPQQKGEKLPVILYIHGGSFTGGSANEKHFIDPIWPTKGVIGVTINYRLGPLGFAVLPQLQQEVGKTGNYGLYDQLTALQWVQHNIETFGGDPNNITIMGQSAGAMSVQQHCLSPLSKGLFHKAVMISGGGLSKMLSASKPEKYFDFWQMIMQKCGATTLEEFRSVPVETLYQVWQENKKATLGGGCFPCIDGQLIIDKGHKVLKSGRQHNIPYLIGTTSEDMVPPILYSMAQNWCKKQTSPAYLWYFEHKLPGDDHGAWHSADLWYWFGTLPNCWRPFDKKDYDLSEEMVNRLVAFAQTGNPNVDGLATWTPAGKKALVFGNDATTLGKPSKLKMWKTMFTVKNPGE